jgi:hypothetical protein
MQPGAPGRKPNNRRLAGRGGWFLPASDEHRLRSQLAESGVRRVGGQVLSGREDASVDSDSGGSQAALARQRGRAQHVLTRIADLMRGRQDQPARPARCARPLRPGWLTYPNSVGLSILPLRSGLPSESAGDTIRSVILSPARLERLAAFAPAPMGGSRSTRPSLSADGGTAHPA